MTLHTKKFEETLKIQDTFEKKMKRGRESWHFFYLVFATIVAVISFVIAILPIENWIFKVLFFLISLGILIWICLISAWWQNKLIGLKIKLEESWKKL